MIRTLLFIAMMLSAQAATLSVCECQLSEHFHRPTAGKGMPCGGCSDLLRVSHGSPSDEHDHHHCDCQQTNQLFTVPLSHFDSDRPSMPGDDSGFISERLKAKDYGRSFVQPPKGFLDQRHAARILIEIWLL